MKLMQFNEKMQSPSIYGLFLRERAKFIDHLKVNYFKGMSWNENFLFLSIPYGKMILYARLNFKETRDLGEFFFENLVHCLDYSQV